MSFRDTPLSFTRTPRCSRDTVRGAYAIERYVSARPSLGHRLVGPVCALIGLVVIFILIWEHL